MSATASSGSGSGSSSCSDSSDGSYRRGGRGGLQPSSLGGSTGRLTTATSTDETISSAYSYYSASSFSDDVESAEAPIRVGGVVQADQHVGQGTKQLLHVKGEGGGGADGGGDGGTGDKGGEPQRLDPKRPWYLRYRKLLVVAGIGAVFILLGTLIFSLIEDLSALDAAYFTVVTLTTIGFGDISPATGEGRVVVVFFGMIGLVSIGYLVSLLTDASSKRMAHIVGKFKFPVGSCDGYVVVVPSRQAPTSRPWWKCCCGGGPPLPHTSIVKGTLNPEWQEDVLIPPSLILAPSDEFGEEHVLVRVLDWDKLSADDVVGHVAVAVAALEAGTETVLDIELETEVVDEMKKHKDALAMNLHEEHSSLVMMENGELREMSQESVSSAMSVFDRVPKITVSGHRGDKGLYLRLVRAQDLPPMDVAIKSKTAETTFENAKHLVLAFVLLVLVMSVGGAIFSLAEGWSFFDAFYFSFVAMTTIGYGDFSPMTTAGRALFIPFSFWALAIFGYIINTVQEYTINSATQAFLEVNEDVVEVSDDDFRCTRRVKKAFASPTGKVTVTLFFTVLVALAMVILGALVPLYVEDYTFSQGVYFWFVTTTTTGFGEFSPGVTSTKLFTIAFSLFGVAVISTVISLITKLSVERAITQAQQDVKELELERQRAIRLSNDWSSAVSISELPPSCIGKMIAHPAFFVLSSLAMFIGLCCLGALAFVYLERNCPFVPENAASASDGASAARFDPSNCIPDYKTAVYFCVVSLSTIGYGDFYPQTRGGRLFFNIFILIGLAFFAFTLSSIQKSSQELIKKSIVKQEQDAKTHGTDFGRTVAAARSKASTVQSRR